MNLLSQRTVKGLSKLALCLTTVMIFFACGCARAPDQDGNPNTDAVMLSDLVQVSRSGETWSANPPGMAANVIHAPDARHDLLEEVSEHCLLFRGVAGWDSNEGLSPLSLSSLLQSGLATFDGRRYVVSGLTGSAAFADDDQLTVSHSSGPVTTVDAPPPISEVNAHIGEPAGAATTFSMPAGADAMFVYVVATGGPPGDSGLMCHLEAAEMASEGSMVSAPIVEAAAASALDTEGWSVGSISVAYYNEAWSDDLFPGLRPAPVQAGRMFGLSGTDLGF